MHMQVQYSSKSDEWETPDDLFARLNGIFKFKHAKYVAQFPLVLVILWPNWFGDAIRPTDLPQ